MANQIAICGSLIGCVESMLYTYRVGMNPMDVLAVVGSGAAGSWTISNYGPRIVDRNFEPGFRVDHFVKDMEIALDEARSMSIALPGLALVHQLYVGIQAQGEGQLGTHALMLALERLSGMVQVSGMGF